MRTKDDIPDVVAYFRVQHHAIAKMLAFGMSDAQVMRNAGITQRRLTLLKRDTAFCELIDYYANLDTADFVANRDPHRDNMWASMAAGEYTVLEHFERAADSGELVPIAVANRISMERADRLGYSKHSVVTHEHDFASALDRAIARSKTVTLEAGEVKTLSVASPHEIVQSLPAPEPVVGVPSTPPRLQPPARASLSSTFKRRI